MGTLVIETGRLITVLCEHPYGGSYIEKGAFNGWFNKTLQLAWCRMENGRNSIGHIVKLYH